jgi:hypothetical protein
MVLPLNLKKHISVSLNILHYYYFLFEYKISRDLSDA